MLRMPNKYKFISGKVQYSKVVRVRVRLSVSARVRVKVRVYD